MKRAPQKRFGGKLAPLALLFFGQAVSPGVPPAVPASEAAFNQPVASLDLASNPSPFQTPELPQTSTMLLAGAALMILGLVGRKRKED